MTSQLPQSSVPNGLSIPDTVPIIEARSLCKSYDEGRVEALRGVDITIAAGEFVAISGPSGSGKSTLLQLIGGLDSPTSGQVLFRNSPLGAGRASTSASTPAIDLDTYRAQHVGFVFQGFYLIPTLRAIENVQVPMLASGSNSRDRARRAEALLVEMGLESRIGHYPNELSGGERQRVAIARALANDPSILLADEPTGNLDSVNSARILEMLIGLQKRRGMTLIVVTHENEIAEAAPRHIRIRDGRVESSQVETGRTESGAGL
ncbi:MAG TPA: ABC transporter ATP-binding protein [Acidobacteriaceae bacterium]|jgi:putative ABC transport system ATP-binding protein|nr:ABC transporter ATP-binding protein [Acidobacteriaceae bacterium]